MPLIPGMSFKIMPVLIIGLVVVVAAVVFVGGDDLPLPGIPGLTEELVLADVELEVWQSGESGTSDYDVVGINFPTNSITTKTSNVMTTLPFGAWFGVEFDGELTLESLKGGTQIDIMSTNVSIWTDAWDVRINNFSFTNLRLGPPGTGQITIRARLYNEDGIKRAEETLTVTI